MHRAIMAYIKAAMDIWEHAFANKCGDKYGIETSRIAQTWVNLTSLSEHVWARVGIHVSYAEHGKEFSRWATH